MSRHFYTYNESGYDVCIYQDIEIGYNKGFISIGSTEIFDGLRHLPVFEKNHGHWLGMGTSAYTSRPRMCRSPDFFGEGVLTITSAEFCSTPAAKLQLVVLGSGPLASPHQVAIGTDKHRACGVVAVLVKVLGG